MKKRIIGILLVVLSVFSAICLGGCGNTADKGNHSDNVEESGSLTEQKILIAFFSRADENYGVGTVEKGNTQIIAEMIAEEADFRERSERYVQNVPEQRFRTAFPLLELPLRTIGLKPYRK